MEKPEIEDYLSLMKQVIDGKLSVTNFEKEYFDLFKSDKVIREEAIFLILDKLFSDCDTFCEDPELRMKDGLDEKELKSFISDAYEKLNILLR